MGFLAGVANIVGKAARFTAKAGGEIVRFGGQVAGGAVELAGAAAGGLVGFANERLGESIKDSAKTAAGIIEAPTEVVTRVGEQVMNAATGAISELVGDVDGEIDALIESDNNNIQSLKDHFKNIAANAGNAWNNLTAKTLFDAAKARYEKLQKSQKQEQTRIDGEISKQNKSIEGYLSQINACRTQSNELFRQFEICAASFADWQVKNRVFAENFTPTIYRLDRLPSCNEIFADVNFDEDPILTTLKGIFTLGFWNESKIKEVQDKLEKMEKYTLPEAIKKGNMEIDRCEKISESLKFVQENFTFFTDFYQELLQELEYSVHLVRCAGYMRNMYFFSNSEKLSPYFLPERHILCLQACDKLSRLLCKMAKRKYFNDSTVDIIKDDISCVEKYRNRVVLPLRKSLAA